MADAEDYEYVYFDVDAGGIEFRKRDLEYFDESGGLLPLYELVMVLNSTSQRNAGYWAGQGITAAPSAPPYPEYPTAEVWTPHPDPKKGRYAWRFVSRLHDLDMQNDEFGPGLEKALGGHEKVQNVIVLSKCDKQPVAVIELAKGVGVSVAADLWKQVIEPENANIPEQARILAAHVIPVTFGEFVRGSEGHLLRRQTQAKFARHIDAVYGKGLKKASVSEKSRYESIITTTEVVQVVENGHA